MRVFVTVLDDLPLEDDGFRLLDFERRPFDVVGEVRLKEREIALIRGQFERGEVGRITGLPERTARRVLNHVLHAGLIASDTPKGAVSLRFPADALEE
jgi:Fic family protein